MYSTDRKFEATRNVVPSKNYKDNSDYDSYMWVNYLSILW